MRFDAIVLAGGQSNRLGADKADVVIRGRTAFDRALEAVAGAQRIIVAGPIRETGVPVEWVREDPPGGGPVAALAAGLDLVSESLVAVLAVDHVFATGSCWPVLSRAGAGLDGAIYVDEGGEDQPLVGLYSRDRLQRTVASMGEPAGRSMREVTGRLRLGRVVDADVALDLDTPMDVEVAGSVLEDGTPRGPKR